MANPKPWFELVDEVRPHVVRIQTPRGSGTGFFFHRTKGQLIAIATAAHVVEYAQYWEEPIRLLHDDLSDPLLLRESDRAIFIDRSKDTAAIVLGVKKVPVPDQPITLAPEGKFLRVGSEIGWLGFPAVAGAQLCFFGGRVSAINEEQAFYLVDGVAINGVSGGPAFHQPDSPLIMGVLSAYIPNRATGEALPGLSVIRDVSHLHELVKDFKSVDEAKSEEKVESEAPPQAPQAQESESSPPKPKK